MNRHDADSSIDHHIAAQTPRGTCPECFYRVPLRRDGMIGGHLIYGAGFGGSPKSCEGAGLYPSWRKSRGKV